MTKQEISLARGNADAVALKKRFHNSQIHQRYLPKGQLAQQLYNSLETARCEIIGARNLPGTATNLDAKIVEDIKQRNLIADIDSKDLSIADAASYLLRQLATGRPLPKTADNLAEKWRDFIESEAGDTIHNACSAYHEQKTFAKLSRQIIKELGYAHELGDDPDASDNENQGTEEDDDIETANDENDRNESFVELKNSNNSQFKLFENVNEKLIFPMLLI